MPADFLAPEGLEAWGFLPPPPPAPPAAPRPAIQPVPDPAPEVPMPAETPASAPLPAPAVQRDPLKVGLILLVTTFALVMTGLFVHAKYLATPAAPAVAVNPKIVPAVQAYLKDYPAAIRQVAADLRAGRIKDADKDGKLDTGDALEAARKASVDALGAIMDSADPAEWEQVAAAFEGGIRS